MLSYMTLASLSGLTRLMAVSPNRDVNGDQVHPSFCDLNLNSEVTPQQKTFKSAGKRMDGTLGSKNENY